MKLTILCGYLPRKIEDETKFIEVYDGFPLKPHELTNHVHWTIIDLVRKQESATFGTYSEIAFLAIRLAIKEYKILCTDVEFKFWTGKGDDVLVIPVDQDGRCSYHPRGFFDESENLLCELLKTNK